MPLRDIELARSEQDDAREIVLRIPRSERLEKQLIKEAEEGDVEFAGAPASPGSVQTVADHEPRQTAGVH
ncbi:MAG: hypothetical protein ACREQR_08350 [Candidatus Binataceae bacterium]